jgi:predicted phosphoadenosine phosphosulfate sulfurtransferase
MCKVLLRNDYWCKGLGQTQPLSDSYQKFKAIKAKRAEAKKIQSEMLPLDD